jgi:hypothetical protein
MATPGGKAAPRMRTITVFYAWQGDRPNNVNRGFIERALNDAATQFNAASTDFEVKIDQDTQGESGTPPVSQTILDKIDRCDVFLPDLTFVAKFDQGKKKGQPTPNPNVLIEYGYALKTKSHRFLMPVMNVVYGGPDGLPFDMGHLRHPIQYRANPTTDEETRRLERANLSMQLLDALRVTSNALLPAVAESIITKEMRLWAEQYHAPRANIMYELIPVPLVTGPRLVMHFLPVGAYHEENEIDFSAVRAHAQSFLPFGYGEQISRSEADGWQFHDPPTRTENPLFPGRFKPQVGQSMWFTGLSRYGIVEFACMIDTVGLPSDAGPIHIDGTLLEALIVNTTERFANALLGVRIEGPAILHATLFDIKDCFLLRGIRGGAGFVRQPIPLRAIMLETLSSPLGNALRPLLDAIWRAAGIADGSPSFGAGTWAGYQRSRA